jgi:Flp pilus assembly protein TadD
MKRTLVGPWKACLILLAVMLSLGRSVPCSAAGDAAAMERLRSAGRNRVLGLQAMKQGDYPTAAQRLRVACQQRPDESSLRLDLAITLFATGQYYQSAGVIKDAFRGFTRDVIAQAKIASYFPTAADYRRAVARLETAQRGAPADIDLGVLLGVVSLVGGQERTAHELFENLLAIDPLQPVARFFLGRNVQEKPRVAPYLLAISARTPAADIATPSPQKLTRNESANTKQRPAEPVYPSALPPAVCFPVLREQVSVAGDQR